MRSPNLSNLLDFKSTRLKLLARTNCLPINQVLYRKNMCETTICQMCSCKSEESVEHFVLECSEYNHINEYLSTNFTDFCFTELPSYEKINILLGECFYKVDPNVCKHVDTFSKKMLREMYTYRSSILEN